MDRAVLLGVICILGMLTTVHGHGYLLQPPARNWVAHKQGRFWNEASGNGLGQGNTGGPGVCGDPFQTTHSNFVNEPSPIQATYKEGSIVELKVILTPTMEASSPTGCAPGGQTWMLLALATTTSQGLTTASVITGSLT